MNTLASNRRHFILGLAGAAATLATSAHAAPTPRPVCTPVCWAN